MTLLKYFYRPITFNWQKKHANRTKKSHSFDTYLVAVRYWRHNVYGKNIYFCVVVHSLHKWRNLQNW